MKIFINRATVNGPWGGGAKFVSALHELAPKFGHRIVSSLDADPHVILLAGLDRDVLGVGVMDAFAHRAANPSCKIALRLNDCDARKGTTGVDRAFWATATGSDSLIFVSEWLRDHLIDRWSKDPESARTSTLPGITRCAQVIHNGVDKELFAPVNSEYRDRLRVVAHHWSDNALKGRDVYEHVDSLAGGSCRIDFTYIGRHQCNFKKTRVVPPLHGPALAAELANHDVYVTGTRFDPGPNHVLEALACGLPVLAHADGGGAVEFVNKQNVFRDNDELTRMLCSRIPRGLGRQPSRTGDYVPLDWSTCVQKYCESFEEMVK